MYKNNRHYLATKASVSLLALSVNLASGTALAATPEPDESGVGGTGHQSPVVAPVPEVFTRPELPPAAVLPVITIPPVVTPSVPSGMDVPPTPPTTSVTGPTPVK